MIKWILLFIVFGAIFYICYCSVKFRNPYRLYMLFGKKGSGKTTFIVKMAMKYMKQGRKVYSTVPVPGAYGFNPQKLGKLMFEPNSVIFFDEAGILFDNRDFKSFSKDKTEYLKLMRHYGVTIYMFSQAFDIDKKIRDLTDYCYLVTNWFNCFSVARKIERRIAIVHADSGGTGESHLADDMEFTPWFTIPFGGAIFTFIPHWAKYFNSFDAPELPLKEFTYYDERTDLYHVTIFDRLRNVIKCRFSRFTRSETDSSLIGSVSSKESSSDVQSDSEDGSGRIRAGSGAASV